MKGTFFSRDTNHIFTIQQNLSAVGASKPAIIRNNVALPQPDGPNSVKTLMLTLSTAMKLPNRLVTFRISSSVITFFVEKASDLSEFTDVLNVLIQLIIILIVFEI